MGESCCGGTALIYTCSGAADVGEIADRVARKLRNDGYAKMTCLAGVGAGLSGYVQSAKGAERTIAVNGCETNCARKALELIGVSPKSYTLTEMGLVKGETPVTEEVVERMCEKIKSASI